ncbi:MAG: DUF4398 domain-containing protein [Gemmatimonadetes bacterium]|nr:DUF4398 domain-containing protein [Gemmatimonadota bacterium]MYB60918.1 DUF4398 domain-containing protein [Gemmatimonadota bacterium]
MSKQAYLTAMSVVACLFVAAACAGPPTEAMNGAEDAMAAAMEAEVDKYAPAEYEAAAAELEMARTHMDAEEYGDAKTAAENAMSLFESASQESVVQKELTKREVDEALPAFLERWGEISGSIERGRGQAARALAQEASAFADSLTVQLNELNAAEKWHDLKTLLESANMTADSFAERAGG